MNAVKRPVNPSHQPIQGHALARCQPSITQSAYKGSHLHTQRAYEPKRIPHRGVRRAIAFEASVKLTVNLLLAIVATTTIAKLIPYYHSQHQRLATLQQSVELAERKNALLRSQFQHNFDPTQAGHIMQEQSGRTLPNQKKIIWQESAQ